MTASPDAFIARWQGRGGGQERANYALFLSELCDVLGVSRPDPASASTHSGCQLLVQLTIGAPCVALSVARFGWKWRKLKLVCPARPVLGVQIIERLGDLDRIDHEIGLVLNPWQRSGSR
jgi:hypothetical protein